MLLLTLDAMMIILINDDGRCYYSPRCSIRFQIKMLFIKDPLFLFTRCLISLFVTSLQMEKNEFSLRSSKETSLTVMSVDSRKGHNNGENVVDKLEDLYSAPEYLNYTHGSQNVTFRDVDPSTVDLVRVTLSTIATATYITGT